MQAVLSLTAGKYPLKGCCFPFTHLRLTPQTKGLLCIASTHPVIQELISAPLQDETLCSCVSTLSTHLLAIPLASVQYPAVKALLPAKPGATLSSSQAHHRTVAFQTLSAGAGKEANQG